MVTSGSQDILLILPFGGADNYRFIDTNLTLNMHFFLKKISIDLFYINYSLNIFEKHLRNIYLLKKHFYQNLFIGMLRKYIL